jgi:hypothetical protein
MGFPLPDVIVSSVVAAFVSAGITTWWWLYRGARGMHDVLEPVTAITKIAPQPSNQCADEPAPDSGVRPRIGARMHAVDSN